MGPISNLFEGLACQVAAVNFRLHFHQSFDMSCGYGPGTSDLWFVCTVGLSNFDALFAVSQVAPTVLDV